MPLSLRAEQISALQNSLLTSPFPYPIILLSGESSCGKSYALKECLFQHASKSLKMKNTWNLQEENHSRSLKELDNFYNDQMEIDEEVQEPKRNTFSKIEKKTIIKGAELITTNDEKTNILSHVQSFDTSLDWDSDEISDIFMKNIGEMRKANHLLKSTFSEKIESSHMKASNESNEINEANNININIAKNIDKNIEITESKNLQNSNNEKKERTIKLRIIENKEENLPTLDHGRVIISIDCHELPFEEQAFFGLLSTKLQRISSSHFDIVKMLIADNRFSDEEAIIYRRRRRGGVATTAAYFLQEMERIQQSYHIPDLIVILNNATEYLNRVKSAPFHHWLGVFSSLYHIFEGRTCLILETCDPKSFHNRDPYSERDMLSIYFPKYTTQEMKLIIQEKVPFYTCNPLFSEFLDIFLGSTQDITRNISILVRIACDIFPTYIKLSTFTLRLQFLQTLLKQGLKYIKNPKLKYMEMAHAIDIKENQEIALGSDEWIEESTNKLSHRQVENELIDPYIINKDMTLLHALTIIATYVAKVQPKELDANMYITESDNTKKRSRIKTLDYPVLRDTTKPIPLTRIIQIFHHILEDPEQDGLKLLRQQRWHSHDINEIIRDLVSLGIMQDANGYSNLNDKKSFYLLADQAFVELIAEPYGISLTAYGIKKKAKK